MQGGEDENPHNLPESRNILKSLKIIQKLPHCFCFVSFYLKKYLKSNKQKTEEVEV